MVARKEITHGTRSGYTHYKCRCNLCKKAFSDYSKLYRNSVKTKPVVEHGTRSSYFYRGCRCEICALVPKAVYATKSDDAKKRNRLKSVFGISLELYNEMVMSQCGLCAICGEPETRVDSRTKEVTKLAVHHNHATGQVIALCCAQCNIGMGNLKDSYILLTRAAELMREV